MPDLTDLLRRIQRDHSFWRELRADPELALSGFDLTPAERAAILSPTIALRRAVESAGVGFGLIEDGEPSPPEPEPEPSPPEPEPEPEPSPPEPEPEPSPSPPEPEPEPSPPEPEPEPSPPEPEPEPSPPEPEPEPEPAPSPPPPSPPAPPPPEPAPTPPVVPFDPHWPPAPPPTPPVVPNLTNLLPPVNDYSIHPPRIWPIGTAGRRPDELEATETTILAIVDQVSTAAPAERLSVLTRLMEHL
jgi:hypothetical protein